MGTKPPVGTMNFGWRKEVDRSITLKGEARDALSSRLTGTYAFAGYAQLYLDGRVQEAACMAHARRKIHDLHAVRPNAVTEGPLCRIGALSKIEEQIRGKPPDERRGVRQARAVALLDDMKRWFEATPATLSAKSDTTKAIRYALNRRPALVYYCSDGRAEIDDLIAERALRGVALGRRNYLFVGADSGGERAAAMYSLIGTSERPRSRGVPRLRA